MHQAILEALSTRASILTAPVAYLNGAPFDPPADGVYVVEDFLPATRTAVGMEPGGSDDFTGIYQLTAMAPRGGHKLTGMNVVTDIERKYPRNLQLLAGILSHWADYPELTSATQRLVRVERVEMAPPQMQGESWAIPVSVHYRAFV